MSVFLISGRFDFVANVVMRDMDHLKSGIAEEHAGSAALFMAFRFAPRDLGGECIETLFPKTAELREPGVHFLQGPGADRVEAARTVRTDFCKPAFAQHPQVLRHTRLRNAELSVNHGNNSAGTLFSVCQNLKHAAADRVAENIEGVRWPSHWLTSTSVKRGRPVCRSDGIRFVRSGRDRSLGPLVAAFPHEILAFLRC